MCTLDFTLGPPDGRSNTSVAAELAEFRKITTFEGKNIIYNEQTVKYRKLVDYFFWWCETSYMNGSKKSLSI